MLTMTLHTGIIFRFGEGRVAFRRSQPAKAIEAYKHAMVVQEQFKSLRFISYWEITVRILFVSSPLFALFASFAWSDKQTTAVSRIHIH
jgi:hypothetical protein